MLTDRDGLSGQGTAEMQPTFWSTWRTESVYCFNWGLLLKSLVLPKLHWLGFRAWDFGACLSLSLHTHELHAESSAVASTPGWRASSILIPKRGREGNHKLWYQSFYSLIGYYPHIKCCSCGHQGLQHLVLGVKNICETTITGLAFFQSLLLPQVFSKEPQPWLTGCRMKSSLPALDFQYSE